MSDKLRPIEPIRLKLMDGKERSFLLSRGSLKKLKQRFEFKSLSDLQGREDDELVTPFFYEALLDKDGMTEEQLDELLPVHEEANRALVMLFGVSLPDRPPVEASPTPPTP